MEIVYTRDDSSGTIHKRYRTDAGDLLTDERDNLDDAGSFTVLAEDAVSIASLHWCERCFAEEIEGEDDGETDQG